MYCPGKSVCFPVAVQPAEFPPPRRRGTGDPGGTIRSRGANRRHERGVAQVIRASPSANPVGVMTERGSPSVDQPTSCRSPCACERARRARRHRSPLGGGEAVAGTGGAHQRQEAAKVAGLPQLRRRGAPARAGHPRRRRLRPADAARGQALPAPQRPRRSTASPGPQTLDALGLERDGARVARTLPRRLVAVAREDRGVRERRRPDRDLARRPLPRQVPVLPRDLARRSAARATRPRRRSAVQDRLAAKLYRQ